MDLMDYLSDELDKRIKDFNKFEREYFDDWKSDGSYDFDPSYHDESLTSKKQIYEEVQFFVKSMIELRLMQRDAEKYKTIKDTLKDLFGGKE